MYVRRTARLIFLTFFSATSIFSATVEDADTILANFNLVVHLRSAIALSESTIHIDGPALFYSNEAKDNGGAIYASDSSLFGENGAQFAYNVAATGSGGGVYSSKAVVSLNGATFTGNLGVWGGGVAHFSSGSIWDDKVDNSGPANITGCTFYGNQATDGGAIYSNAGYDMVVNSYFSGNIADVQGGALLHSGVLVALVKSSFESNRAGEAGPAVMSLGLAENIAEVSFQTNSFFCGSGEYGFDNSSEGADTCRIEVVCSRCNIECNSVPGNITLDEATVPVCGVIPTGVNLTKARMTVETLDLIQGYYRTSRQSHDVRECYKSEACIGGSNATNYCAQGYAGPWANDSSNGSLAPPMSCIYDLFSKDCAVCEEGFTSRFQYNCHICQGSERWAAVCRAVAVLIVALFVVTLVVVYLVRVERHPISEGSGRWERWLLDFRHMVVRAIPLTAIKIVIVTWQIITQISGVVNVEYPPAYENFLAALSVANLNLGSILSLSCVFETNFYERLVLATVGPIAVLGALAIIYIFAVIRNGHSIRAMRAAKSKHLSVVVFLLFILYSSVSYTIFQTFVCDPMDSGVAYLRADYGLECWTDTHKAFMTYAGIMALMYPVGIPAAFAWWLFTNRYSIENVDTPAWTGFQSEPERYVDAAKDLWAPYKRNRYYYEVAECGRRLALAGLAVFIHPDSSAQIATEALFAVMFYAVFEILSPFVDPLDMWLYRSGAWIIYLSMYLALLLKVGAAEKESYSQNLFAWLLIAAHGGMALVVVIYTLLSAFPRVREVKLGCGKLLTCRHGC